MFEYFNTSNDLKSEKLQADKDCTKIKIKSSSEGWLCKEEEKCDNSKLSHLSNCSVLLSVCIISPLSELDNNYTHTHVFK